MWTNVDWVKNQNLHVLISISITFLVSSRVSLAVPSNKKGRCETFQGSATSKLTVEDGKM